MRLSFLLVTGALLAPAVLGQGFSSLDAQLTPDDVKQFDAISFADAASFRTTKSGARCKVFPGDADWPSQSEWSRFNASLGGVLLKPLPPASVCYSSSPAFDAAKCDFLLNNASRTTFFLDDPVTILTQWPQGNTCLAARNATGSCTQGGFPVYVVNATSIKHVQAAVNFARNRKLRLVIKYGASPRTDPYQI